ncbi:MAG: hypothetical protein P8O97_04505 [Gammaproteobacteria bacterium]|nr:hypothetical protein [Gammaproteobacteria bacterium]
MFVCICQQIRESDITTVVDQGVSSEAEARKILGACSDCGQCKATFRKCFRNASSSNSHIRQVSIPIIAQQPGNSSRTT